jgi:hypothetical protein
MPKWSNDVQNDYNLMFAKVVLNCPLTRLTGIFYVQMGNFIPPSKVVGGHNKLRLPIINRGIQH